MDEEDTTTFSQSDLPCVSFAALENMRKAGQLCDLTIKVQSHSFFAHRAILAAAIPYFENVFSSCAAETGETEIAVQELDPEALESLIRFAYTSEVLITLKNAQSLLVASEFLQLNQVRDACVEFLSKRLCVDNVLGLYTFACGLNTTDLVKSCIQFIIKNFEQFIKCDDFLRLPHSCVKKIISNDDLNTSSEEIVFESLMKWVKASLDERHAALPELLCEIRMIYLPIHYVIDQVESEELIISSKPCSNLVNEVKNYHLLKERRLEFPNLKKRPRNQLSFDLYSIFVCNACGCSVNRFDVAIEMWSVLASDETKRKSISAVVAVNDIIYMFLDTTIQTFNLKIREWNVLDAQHKNIEGAATVCNGKFIYCFGSKDTEYMQYVRCFDTQLKNWVQLGKVNTKRYDHAAVSLGNTSSIYVTGGCSSVTLHPEPISTYNFGTYRGSSGFGLGNSSFNIVETILDTVEKYSTSTGLWHDVRPMLSARRFHGCCSMNERVYVCGGYNTISFFSELSTAEVYDPLTDQWNFISSMKKPRSRVSLVAHFNKLYAFGQWDLEVYDPKTTEWGYIFSVPRGFASSVLGPLST